MSARTPYTIISEKDLGKSQKEFEIEIGAEAFEARRTAMLKSVVAEAELPGFRKGKAPESVVLKEYGEARILERTADDCINEAVFSVLAEKQISFVGQPSIAITMLAPKNPLKFKMTVSFVPEISLPDYKLLAAKENKKTEPEPAVSDKELEESVTYIRNLLARQGGDEKNPPELTDELVKKFGDFASVSAFKDKLKTDLLTDKKNRAQEKKLLEIIERIVNETKIEVPEALVENELDRIESEFAHDIERMGQKPEEYYAKIKKTREELRKEWRDNAEKRAKFELILPRLARAENIKVAPEEVEHETTHLLEHYKDADREAAKLYVEKALVRQKVLDFLKQQK